MMHSSRELATARADGRSDKDGVGLDAPRDLIDRLNKDCFCITLDHARLDAALAAETCDADFAANLLRTRPHLLASAPVFLASADRDAMLDIVRALEAATLLPRYRDAVLAWAPAIARPDHGPIGAFMGYDFHLTPDGPKLIEINTNAGGAFINAALAQAQAACCAEVERALPSAPQAAFEAAVRVMVESEWRRQGRTHRLTRVAIVDDRPEEQYLYPEFVLAKRTFERHGVQAIIADPGELMFEDGALRHDGAPIDLLYNRLVDFSLADPDHASIRVAYEAGAVVLTPNPHNHALLADKRNLTLFSDPELLKHLGLDSDHARALAHIPETRLMRASDPATLWAERKRFFFKPAAGHGGKAVYRGDKLTQKAWRDILAGDYIAQAYVQPGERYQGQTTNFRTPGGGFAPVYFV